MSDTDQDHSDDPDKSGFTLLLIALVLATTIAPLFEFSMLGRLVLYASVTAAFAATIVAHRHRRSILVPGIVIAVIATALDGSSLLLNLDRLWFVGYFFEILFFGTAAVLTLREVLRVYAGTLQALTGALCVYLLIGLTWAFAYAALEHLADRPFDFDHHQESGHTAGGRPATRFTQLLYFSFVTMSTLGYGDITPRTPLALTLTWVQSVVGQFYLAVLVARLISTLPRNGTDE